MVLAVPELQLEHHLELEHRELEQQLEVEILDPLQAVSAEELHPLPVQKVRILLQDLRL